ncbi:uncharacterized protein LOC116288348 isoform X1 [Actinia tenebrosa]|uniref:Uncharacterized protein LOC116288348 isoform X1 n=1 Tax=Actinia tenebrosa TaxID=6105 RepID=A0A6P8H667_ACTTE|nr:uncharacterized protein LOC116288348 isoform X1 [Actinia tenebrosa]
MILPLLATFALMFAFVPGSDEATTAPVTNYAALATCLKVSSPLTATATKILDHVTVNQYIIVPPSGLLSSNSNRQSTTTVSSKGCPFVWRTDFDNNRRPSILLKAVCPTSNAICTKCHAITYGHRVLKYKCNALWDWATVNLPVAFVRV